MAGWVALVAPGVVFRFALGLFMRQEKTVWVCAARPTRLGCAFEQHLEPIFFWSETQCEVTCAPMLQTGSILALLGSTKRGFKL